MVFFVIKRSVRSSSSSEMHREAVFLVPGFYPNEENFLLSPSYAFGCDNFQARDPNDANKNPNNSMSYAGRLSVTGGLIGKGKCDKFSVN